MTSAVVVQVNSVLTVLVDVAAKVKLERFEKDALHKLEKLSGAGSSPGSFAIWRQYIAIGLAFSTEPSPLDRSKMFYYGPGTY